MKKIPLSHLKDLAENAELDSAPKCPSKSLCVKCTLLLVSILAISACGKIRGKVNEVKNTVSNKVNSVKEKVIDEIREPVINAFDLFEKFPEFIEEKFQISEPQGLKCEYLVNFYRYYFYYHGDIIQVQDFITKIKSEYSEIEPDSTFIEIKAIEFDLKYEDLTNLEKEKADFFFEYRKFSNIQYYRCIRTPEIHNILYDVDSRSIFHMIENFRE